METPVKLMLPIVVVIALIASSPADAWYKQMAGPSYYSVGRASGLLSGIRRSPYVRRAEPNTPDSGESSNVLTDINPQSSILKSMVSGDT